MPKKERYPISKARTKKEPNPVGIYYSKLPKRSKRMVEEWIEIHTIPNLEIQPSTPKIYAKWFKRFIHFHRCTPEDTLQWSTKTATKRMEDFKASLINRGLAKNTIIQSWSAIKKWFYDHDVIIHKKCKGVRGGKRQFDYIPTKEQLDMILGVSPLHYRTAFALVAFSGMRPVDVTLLRFEDIMPSYGQGDEVLSITIIQQKTQDRYFTFLGPQGTAYVRELIEKRRNNGENITRDSFVVSKNGSRMNRRTLRGAFRSAIEKTTGLNPTGESFRKFRLYGLRKYFRFCLRDLNEAEAEYLMGHKAAADSLRGLARIYSGLNDLDSKAIANLKEKYTANLPNLETRISDPILLPRMDKLEARLEYAIERAARAAGISKADMRAEIQLHVGGGKTLRREAPEVIIEELETGQTHDPLEDLGEDELDTLFIRALRKKLMVEE
ncbi:MAG: tyrosine-type recombinase/integrase [Candidatus Thorarchaeota archaeon]|jgi:integrase